MRALGALPLAAVLATTACRGPNLVLNVDTQPVRLAADGGIQPVAPIVLPFRYYGVTELQAWPTDEAAGRFAKARRVQHVEVLEPVTPWIFPFDFPAECLIRLFGGEGMDDQTVLVSLPDNPVRVVERVVPPETEGVRARSAAARIAR